MADDVLQQVKDRLDLVEVISGYIPLRKSGLNYKAVCPFHNEKTPSLMVSPQKQIWHCFGCGEGGDVFGFVMRYENIEFREALKLLADKAGVTLPAYSGENKAEMDYRNQLLRINAFAAELYHQFLMTQKAAAPARDYLLKRSLSDKTIKAWKIGFAPDDFHFLEQALATKKVAANDLVAAGVSVKNDRAQVFDRFRNRITFPICNYHGEVVGFSARILQGDDTAKYINSPETPLYSKGKVLFGLNFAKEAIRKADAAVIVEGQMDCIQAHQAGFNNTVASSGTALTTEQLKFLGRLTKNLIFCFDADSAGQTATRRAGELALGQGFRIRIIVLPHGKDPDELIRSSAKEWKTAVNNALWFIEYYIEQAAANYAIGSVDQKRHISEAVVPLLNHITDPIELDHYTRIISDRFGITESAVRSMVRTNAPTAAGPGPRQVSGVQPHANALEKQVLGGILTYPEYAAFADQHLTQEDFEDPEIRRHMAQKITDTPLAKEVQFVVESELELLEGNTAALMRQLEKSAFMLKIQAIKRHQQHLSLEIKTAEQQKDKSRVDSLQQQFSDLSARRLEYEKKF
jgi:DNA primase